MVPEGVWGRKMGNLAASWPLAATHGGRGFRNPLSYGEPAGTRTQGPRLKRAILLSINALFSDILSCFRKICGSQHRQRHFNHLHDLLMSVLDRYRLNYLLGIVVRILSHEARHRAGFG